MLMESGLPSRKVSHHLPTDCLLPIQRRHTGLVNLWDTCVPWAPNTTRPFLCLIFVFN